jgi:hypothetical protein
MLIIATAILLLLPSPTISKIAFVGQIPCTYSLASLPLCTGKARLFSAVFLHIIPFDCKQHRTELEGLGPPSLYRKRVADSRVENTAVTGAMVLDV